MFKKFKILYAALFLILPLQIFAAEAVVKDSIKDKDTHFYIGNQNHRFDNNMNCEIAVLVSKDYSQVKVVRVDNRKGAYNVNYLINSPSLFQRYGVVYDLQQEVPLNGATIENVSAVFDLKELLQSRFDKPESSRGTAGSVGNPH